VDGMPLNSVLGSSLPLPPELRRSWALISPIARAPGPGVSSFGSPASRAKTCGWRRTSCRRRLERIFQGEMTRCGFEVRRNTASKTKSPSSSQSAV